MKKNKKLILCSALCLLSIIGMTLSLLANNGKSDSPFVPPPFDPHAQVGNPTVPEGLGYGELDAEIFKASVCGVFILENTKADIWLTNPADNTVWLKLRVIDSTGNALGETGLIKPGEYVQTVNLVAAPKQDEPISLKLMAYEPETYYSAGEVNLNVMIELLEQDMQK